MKGKLSAALAASAVALGAYRVRKPKPLGIRYSDAPTKVLVVGGGFGGLAAVRELARAFGGGREVGVALLDRVNYMTFWPMVPAVISGTSRCATWPAPSAASSSLRGRSSSRRRLWG